MKLLILANQVLLILLWKKSVSQNRVNGVFHYSKSFRNCKYQTVKLLNKYFNSADTTVTLRL